MDYPIYCRRCGKELSWSIFRSFTEYLLCPKCEGKKVARDLLKDAGWLREGKGT